MSTSRLEAFSDGVIAVAITLLVLDIHVPTPPLPAGTTLAHELGANWPVYAAYITSFLTIGIIWINHHVMIRRLREPDHMILFLNLLLLMSIAVLPFATSLMAAYLRESRRPVSTPRRKEWVGGGEGEARMWSGGTSPGTPLATPSRRWRAAQTARVKARPAARPAQTAAPVPPCG